MKLVTSTDLTVRTKLVFKNLIKAIDYCLIINKMKVERSIEPQKVEKKINNVL